MIGVTGEELVVVVAEDEVMIERFEEDVSQDGSIFSAGFRKVLYVDPKDVYLMYQMGFDCKLQFAG